MRRKRKAKQKRGRNVAGVEAEAHIEERRIGNEVHTQGPGGRDRVQAPRDMQPSDEARSQHEACAGEMADGGKGADSAAGLQNLAAFYHVHGLYHIAERLYLRALRSFEQEKGQDIAPTAVATTLRNLALLYENQGRYQEAEALYRQAQRVMEQAPEGERATAISIMRDYADLLHTMGREQEARDLEVHFL